MTVETAEQRRTREQQRVLFGVERTRATYLSYGEQDQADFTVDLKALLKPGSHIDLIQESYLAMAPTVS